MTDLKTKSRRLAVVGLALVGVAVAVGLSAASPLLAELRLIRLALALLLGAALGIAGALLQTSLRNALAEPHLLGLSAGANLTATAATVWLPALCVRWPLFLPFVACMGAFGALLLVGLLARSRTAPPTRLLLIGVAIGGALHALTLVVATFSDFTGYLGVLARQIGGLAGAEGRAVLLLGGVVAVLAPLAWRLAPALNVMTLGDDAAVGLGVSVKKARRMALCLAAGLSGACVAVGGGVAFVGLLAPHLARRLVGADHRVGLPAAAGIGSLLVLAADGVGRMVAAPAELPAGLFVGVLGAPALIYLLARRG